ncbi:hypothetical protein Acr_18g0010850 [Actinidia rufa]|uniref:Reverse transcriptase domain-containing protein n=1 Tax=Actinidia rufa TaxID=165716 RepID=A0A7J0G7Y2_9ERIC|nr:hypothetical protein Acr_18g0010850 [Actinidia rufa]
MIKSNKAKNQIISLTKADGTVTTSAKQISSLFVDYYTNLLGKNSDCPRMENEMIATGPLVQEEQSLQLISPVLDEEIKTALFDIGDDKAPGPDGYTACFYKKSWTIVGADVCEAVQEFFRSRKILKQINHATIVLVPKSGNASKVEDFRPIACCNVIYKIISKILASRLSNILEDLIDPAQSAFIPNRSMIENIYLVQELLRKYHWKRISPRCIMKIDFRKAYDTINWVFLEDMLRVMGFPDIFCKLDNAMRYNCSLFHIHKWNIAWLFQGTARKLRGLRRNPEFKHHPKCADLNITHLAFADDLILFTRGDTTSVRLSMECLKNFGDYSGLSINKHKSNIFMAGINSEDMEEIKAITEFNMGTFLFRYLGIPIAAARLTVETIQPSNFPDIGPYQYMGRDKSVLRWTNNSFWDYTPAKQDSQMLRQLASIRDRIAILEGTDLLALNRLNQWAGTGKFNAEAAYEFFRPRGPKICWTKLVWHHSIMPKQAFILWLSMKERLLTKEKMIEQIEDTSCALCGDQIESVNHLFFHCSTTYQIWTEIRGWLGFSRALTTLKAAAKWIKKEARGTGAQAIAKKTGFAATVYFIWKARNAKIFEGTPIQTTSIIRDIKIQVYRGLYEKFPNLQHL